MSFSISKSGYRAKSVLLTLVVLLISPLIYNILFLHDQTDSQALKSNTIQAATSTNPLADLPLRFISNVGQLDADVTYHAEGIGHTLLFSKDNIVFHRRETDGKNNAVTLNFIGVNPLVTLQGVDEQAGKTNLYKGSDPDKWYTDIPSFGSIEYKNLYAGIDMVYLGENGQLKSEFYVAPGTDHRQIRLNYSGLESQHIREDGALVLALHTGEIIEDKPLVYQERYGEKQIIEAEYVIHDDQTIGFTIDQYDADLPLVIDPEFDYATYLTGNNYSVAAGVAIDSEGHLLVGGYTRATDFPVQNAFQGENAGNYDAFVSKIDTANGIFVYSTYLGGTFSDQANDFQLDDQGNAYIAGYSTSTDFPTTQNAYQIEKNGFGSDAFVAKLSPTGALLYSTFLGGGLDENENWGVDVINKIVLGPTGELYLAGETNTIDFPTVNPVQGQLGGGTDAFVAELNPAGDSLRFSTYFGGSGPDEATGIGLDDSGNVYVGGTTESIDLQTVSAFQDSSGGAEDAFVLKLNSSGNTIKYSTYYGGSAVDQARDIAVDSVGNVFIVGRTFSSDFPIMDGAMGKRSFRPAQLEESDSFMGLFDQFGLLQYSEISHLLGTDYFVTVILLQWAQYNYAIAAGFVPNGMNLYYFRKLNESIEMERVDENPNQGWTQVKSLYAQRKGLAVVVGTTAEWVVSDNGWERPNPPSGSDEIYVWVREEILGQAAIIADVYITDLYGEPVEDSLEVGEFYSVKVILSNPGVIETALNIEGKLLLFNLADKTISKPTEWFSVNWIFPLFEYILAELAPGETKEFSFLFVATSNKPINVIGAEIEFQGDNTNHITKQTPDITLLSAREKKAVVSLRLKQSFAPYTLSKLAQHEFVDIYVDSVLIFDDLTTGSPQQANFELATTSPVIDITSGIDIDNSNPLSSFQADLLVGEGEETALPDNFGLVFSETGTDSFKLLLKKDLKNNSADSTKVEFFITHTAENSGSIDLQLVEGTEQSTVLQVLYDDIEPDSVTEYVSVDADNHFIKLSDADNSQEYGVFNFDLSAYAGEALIGFIEPDSQQIKAVLVLYDSEGKRIEGPNTTSLADQGDPYIPLQYNLEQNYPNPFNPSTKIRFSIAKDGFVSLILYDLLGREAITLFEGNKKSGVYEINFDAKNLVSGVYIYRLQTADFAGTKKMLLLK
jgi:hypothetical protein